MVLRAHHAIADGPAAVALLGKLLDVAPSATGLNRSLSDLTGAAMAATRGVSGALPISSWWTSPP